MRHFAAPPYARRGETGRPDPRCPRCGGSRSVSSAQPLPPLQRFFGREQLRCADCRHRFGFTHKGQAVANLLLVATMLVGLGLTINQLSQSLSQLGKTGPQKARKR